MKATTTRTANRNTAARSLTRSVVAELVGDRHVDAALLALSRRWDAARPVVVATAQHAAQRARVLALAGLAVALLAGRCSASRGASLAVSAAVALYALCCRNYPAARSATVTTATVGVERAAAVLAWLTRRSGRTTGDRFFLCF
jgi:hypothetical protein